MTDDNNIRLSIIVPVYNEAEVLNEFYQRLIAVLAPSFAYEILFINDGSSDNTLQLLQELQHQDHNIGIIDLSRNFGSDQIRGAVRGAVVHQDDFLVRDRRVADLADKIGQGLSFVVARDDDG